MDGPLLRHRCLNRLTPCYLIHRCLVSRFSCLCNLPCVIIDRRLFVCKASANSQTSERLTLIPITRVTWQVPVVVKSQHAAQHAHISSTPEVHFCVFCVVM